MQSTELQQELASHQRRMQHLAQAHQTEVKELSNCRDALVQEVSAVLLYRLSGIAWTVFGQLYTLLPAFWHAQNHRCSHPGCEEYVIAAYRARSD